MKKGFILTFAFSIIIAFGSITVSAQDAESNPNAPQTYDANLKTGDLAVAVTSGVYLETVRIVSKSSNVYKVIDQDDGETLYFQANAVYPFFDVPQFGKIIDQGKNYISPYLECYAQKHNLDFDKVKGNSYSKPYFANVQLMEKQLQEELPNLAETENLLKTLAARPDTFAPFVSNPAVWVEIASKRAEYFQCAVGERETRDIKDSPWLSIHKQDIAKTLKRVNDYDPATKISMGSDTEYALYAVSLKKRDEWLRGANALVFKEPLDIALKPLAEALAKKLPTYFPKMEKYSVRNAGEEALMKRALENPARYKIFKVGLMQSAWQIDQGVLGIPNARYKNGLIYLRDTEADHPYCYATYVNVIQDYAGGGRYAASRSKLVLDELVGCPAGAK